MGLSDCVVQEIFVECVYRKTDFKVLLKMISLGVIFSSMTANFIQIVITSFF